MNPYFRFLALGLSVALPSASIFAVQTKTSEPASVPSSGNEESKENLKALQDGIDLIQAKKYAEAEKVFASLRKAKVQKSTWGMASNNLGITFRIQKKYKEAIVVFESVLTSEVNDRDEGGSLMETFRNYRYNACNEIARCYVETKDYPKALDYLSLAKTKYKFQADCSTCESNAAEDLARRTNWVKSKIAATPAKAAARE